ncbi:MAG: preprotein translocase subunit SecE [Minisyncoccia bacterium]
MLAKFKNYIKEVKNEFKHVNWLTKNQAIKYTLIVIGLSLIMAMFLGLCDFLFTGILSRFILQS